MGRTQRSVRSSSAQERRSQKKCPRNVVHLGSRLHRANWRLGVPRDRDNVVRCDWSPAPLVPLKAYGPWWAQTLAWGFKASHESKDPLADLPSRWIFRHVGRSVSNGRMFGSGVPSGLVGAFVSLVRNFVAKTKRALLDSKN